MSMCMPSPLYLLICTLTHHLTQARARHGQWLVALTPALGVAVGVGVYVGPLKSALLVRVWITALDTRPQCA